MLVNVLVVVLSVVEVNSVGENRLIVRFILVFYVVLCWLS